MLAADQRPAKWTVARNDRFYLLPGLRAASTASERPDTSKVDTLEDCTTSSDTMSDLLTAIMVLVAEQQRLIRIRLRGLDVVSAAGYSNATFATRTCVALLKLLCRTGCLNDRCVMGLSLVHCLWISCPAPIQCCSCTSSRLRPTVFMTWNP